MIKIGINGFGRIGRAITRIISNSKDLKISVINDIDDNVKNLTYLLKYDSIYGKFNKIVKDKKNNQISINKNIIKFYSKKIINEVPWAKHEVDIVIDSSGVEKNVINSKKILGKTISKVLITHSPDKNVDSTLILGVNEKSYDYKKHNVISSSICDASALGPILNQLEKKYGIENGYITTLHPRLSYQNLLDGSLKSVSNPGHSWKNYSLGRDSISNLILKKTTAVKAVTKCIKSLEGKISGMSFRVPTSIVCASDITIKLKSNITKETLSNHFKKLSISQSKIFGYQEEPLVSSDHLGTSKSVIVDANFIDVIDSNLIKMVIWYDNEWGYSNRVVDIAKLVLKKN
jgi:glyceraldehyde 3-phosphate dehydrogenase